MNQQKPVNASSESTDSDDYSSPLMTLFEAFDKNNNGVLDPSEFKQMMRELNLSQALVALFQMPLDALNELIQNIPQIDDLASMLAAVDTNHDGNISAQELEQILPGNNIVSDLLMRIVTVAIGDAQVLISDLTTFYEEYIPASKIFNEEQFAIQIKDIFLAAIQRFVDYTAPMNRFKARFESLAGVDDYVSREQLTGFIRHLPGRPLPLLAVREIVAAADVDGDGQISFEAFARAYVSRIMVERFGMLIDRAVAGLSGLLDDDMMRTTRSPAVTLTQWGDYDVEGMNGIGGGENGYGGDDFGTGMEKYNENNGEFDNNTYIGVDVTMIGFWMLIIAMIVGILVFVYKIACKTTKKERYGNVARYERDELI